MKKIIFYISLLLFLFIGKIYSQQIPIGFFSNTSSVEQRNTKVFYISKNGNDDNIGTSKTKSWKTISRLFYEHIIPGDTIRFKGGDTIYGRNVFNIINFISDTSKRVVINSYDTGKAVLRPDSSQVSVLEFNYKDKIKIEISNLIFMGNYNPLTQLGGLTNTYGIVIYNSNYADVNKRSDSMLVKIDSCEFTKFVYASILYQHTPIWSNTSYQKRKGIFRLTNNKFYNLGDIGIMASGIKGWSSYIYNNSFEKIRGRTGQPYTFAVCFFNCSQMLFYRNYVDSIGKYESHGSCGLYCGESDSIIYRGNEVRNMYGNLATGSIQECCALYLDGFCQYNIMEYNYVGNCYGTAIGMTNGNYNIFRYNIVILDSCTASGIGLGYGGLGAGLEDRVGIKTFIYNNTFYMKKNVLVGITAWSSVILNMSRNKVNLDSVFIFNNIFYADSSRAWLIDSSRLANNFFIHNNIYYDQRGDSSKLVGRVNSSAGYLKTFRQWINVHNMADSTGFEKTGGVYTYYNSNPLITYIGKRHSKINPFYLDTLNSYKVYSYSSNAINHGTNYNSIIKTIADTCTVDFYGNSISYTSPDIGHYEFQGTSPSVITLSSPANATEFSQGIFASFNWATTSTATSYYLVIYNNLGDTVDSYTTTLGTQSVAIGYSYTESYLWKVLSRNQFGSTWSNTTRTFTISEF